MERSAWSDERLDDMAARGDSQFELLRAEIAGVRAEMAGFRVEMRAETTAIRAEMAAMRAEFREDMTLLRGELHDTRRDMFHGALALFGSQVAILAVLLAQSL